jgi:pimeloyl-ACP methyl ester carboxylesterase
MSLLLLSLALGLSQPVSAWPDDLRDYAIRTVGELPAEPFRATLHGVLRETWKHRKVDSNYEVVTLRHSLIEDGVPTYLRRVRGSDRLVVALNPLFAGLGRGQMNRYLDEFPASSVWVVPNPFSSDWTDQHLDYRPGELLTEREILLSWLREVRRRLPDLERVDVVGLSYGALLAAAAKALDSQRDRPLITGKVLLLSPPIDIFHSKRVLDRFIRSTTRGHGWCSALVGKIYAAYNGFLVRDPNRLSISEPCARVFMSQVGFQDELESLVERLVDHGTISPVKGRVSFSRYFREIVRERIPQRAARIDYWIRQAADNGYRKVYMLGSADDIINRGVSVDSLYSKSFARSQVLYLAHGGHTGFRSSLSRDPNCPDRDWYSCVIRRLLN